MISLEDLYAAATPLSDAQGKPEAMAKLTSNYSTMLCGVKSDDFHVKRLTSQFIARFFSDFPTMADVALDAFLDLCEDNDVSVRITAIKDIPQLCRQLKEYLPKIVDVLAQLLQSDDKSEIAAIHVSLQTLFKRDAKGTLIGLFSQIKNGGDVVRERAITFLFNKIQKEGGSSLIGKEAEFTLLTEIKAVLKDCSAVEFQMFMIILSKTSIPKSVTGQTQLLEIALSMAELDKDFDASDADCVNKFMHCADQAAKYFSSQVRATKFCEYLMQQVLPQLHAIADLDSQSQMLKILGECTMFADQVSNPMDAARNIYRILLDYMPLPPEDAVEAAEAGQDPEFEFTKVECLLLAYHKVGRQVPQHLTEDEKTLSDFRKRLIYFASGVKAYIKKLNEFLKDKSKAERLKEENKLKETALVCTTNIHTLIKDLCHLPPIYKAVVRVSWRPEWTDVKVDNLARPHGPEAPKRKLITFDPPSATNGKQLRESSRGGTKFMRGVYTPPTGKYSSAAGNYDENTRGGRWGRGRGRGRGGRWSRGRGRYSY